MNNPQVRNQAIVHAPVSRVWSVITDIQLLKKIIPGVIEATGCIDKPGDTRTCNLVFNGKKGTVTERLIELIPETKTVWTIEHDTMGMSKMLKNNRFVFHLHKIDDHTTRLVNETWYKPGNLMAMIMNGLMMKRMFSKTQEQILHNIKSLIEK